MDENNNWNFPAPTSAREASGKEFAKAHGFHLHHLIFLQALKWTHENTGRIFWNFHSREYLIYGAFTKISR